jgi:hypothetical protein
MAESYDNISEYLPIIKVKNTALAHAIICFQNLEGDTQLHKLIICKRTLDDELIIYKNYARK